MDHSEFKRKLLDTGLFRKVSGDGQYVCKTCPFCGDMKNHMYVSIKQGNDSPVMYHCFKCNAGGILNDKFLEYFGIDDIPIPKFRKQKRIQPSGSYTEIEDLLDAEKHGSMIEMASQYIASRVGVTPTLEDLKKFQIIGNPWEYVKAYLGGDEKGLRNRVWFRLSNGNMVGRSTDPNVEFRWRKYNGTQMGMKGIYTIKHPVDTYQTINVCISEGVMDAIGLFYHYEVSNPVYIACMGKDYTAGIEHVLNMGIFGDSVNIRVMKDADVDQIRIPRGYSQLFKDISIYQNSMGKDFGLTASEISIEKCL